MQLLKNGFRQVTRSRWTMEDGRSVFLWIDIREMLFKALKECLESNTLLTSMKQAIIVLIHKTKKDNTLIDNLRPIKLLNIDYKIFTHALASSGIDKIISDTQSGFLPNRLIHNNIRLVLDLLDSSHLIEDNGIILFPDFFKKVLINLNTLLFYSLCNILVSSKEEYVRETQSAHFFSYLLLNY